jgi:pimeloyl-ACP methyl ester carboxylesterase
LDAIVEPWTGENGKAAFYRQIAQASSTFTGEVQPLYPDITRPVMILWGREDVWIPIEKGEALHQMIPGSVFHAIPESGHLVIEERPGELLGYIEPFLAS